MLEQNSKALFIQAIQTLVKKLLVTIGEDPNREGLLKTPYRVAKAYEKWFGGYSQDPKAVLETTFSDEAYSQMVLLTGISFFSHCEHHLAPFYGKIHVGYIPRGKIVGISKLARLVEVYSRRLQTQERLTDQIAQTFFEVCNPLGVGVLCKGIHMCIRSRGVEQADTVMTTSSLLGNFLTENTVRVEFLRLVGMSEGGI